MQTLGLLGLRAMMIWEYYSISKTLILYILMADAHYLPWVTIEESEHTDEYVCVWEIKYVWFFFKWIKTKDEQTGIS